MVKLRPHGGSRAPWAVAYARATLPGPRTHWREARLCVVDLELTGLDVLTDEIISYGAVPIDHGRVGADRTVYGLVRPAHAVSGPSVLVHGIRRVDLDGAPRLEEAIAPLAEAMTGRVLVAHAASVERAFLGAALRHFGVRLREPVIDTEVLGRLLMAERGSTPPPFLRLGELVAYLGLPEHRPHHALGDALTTAQAFLALATHLEACSVSNVRSLARAADRLAWMTA